MERLWLSLFVITAPISTSWAGDHVPVCQKVKRADLVVEARFRVKGRYTKALQAKAWGPSQSALDRTRVTGKLKQVFKGDAQVGQRWDKAWPVLFMPGSPRVEGWVSFFTREHFSQVVFLRKTAKGWRSVAGAEESAGCASSAHRSWCPGYADYRRALRACLQGDERAKGAHRAGPAGPPVKTPARTPEP